MTSTGPGGPSTREGDRVPAPTPSTPVAKQLFVELHAGGLNMLADAVPKIEAFVYTEWQVDHMPWFTDHGPGHSERVAAFAMDLGTPTKIHPDLSLNLIEKFILWSAAWLHDIGMQQLLGTALGGGNETIYGRIRSQHPDQSSIVILNKAQLIGLPPRDAPLIGAIAYVARAHGTAYYEESVSTLETSSPYMHGKQIRGGLLAAILLMADEIDLAMNGHYACRCRTNLTRSRMRMH